MGGFGGPVPGDPDSSNVVLSATPAFGGIDVTWSYPAVNPGAVGHVKLYRSNSSDFGGAILLNIVNGTFYYDRVDANIQYWYWIQIVSINGTVGELIGPATASARPLIEDLIEQLTAKIDSGLLAITLRAKLDEISLLNENLLDEILARENANVSLADAIAAAEAGTAEALTFIANEQASRVTADSAIAENIDIVAATLGGDFAAVTTAMQVDIDATDGHVNAIYSAKVLANDLIGGFGIWNDSHTVQAGFDVDTFWVGRTGPDKRKPFIVVGGEVFIDEAVINKLTFSKLRDESGSFIVAGGKVKADYITIANAMITNAMIADAQVTNAKIGNGEISTAKIGDAQITNAKIGNAQVSTLKIGDNAVTVPVGYSTPGTCGVGLTVPDLGTGALPVFISGTIFISSTSLAAVKVDGTDVWNGAGVSGSTCTAGVRVFLNPGAHYIEISSAGAFSAIPSSIFAMCIQK